MSWTLIETVTVSGSSTATVTLGNGGTIPQTYKTLKVLISARDASSANHSNMNVTFNNDTSGTFATTRRLYGTGSSVVSDNIPNVYYVAAGHICSANATANTFGNMEIVIPNYANAANTPISMDSVTENNATAAEQHLHAGLRATNGPINRIDFFPPANFVSGTTFTLYGLA